MKLHEEIVFAVNKTNLADSLQIQIAYVQMRNSFIDKISVLKLSTWNCEAKQPLQR